MDSDRFERILLDIDLDELRAYVEGLGYADVRVHRHGRFVQVAIRAKDDAPSSSRTFPGVQEAKDHYAQRIVSDEHER